MTQEEKELLLKDLSARLSYDVKVQYCDNETKKLEVGIVNACMVTTDEDNQKYQSIITTRDVFVTQGNVIEDIKPYLFPLSSITDEQIMQSPNSIHVCDLENLRYDDELTELNSRFPDLIDLIDWLNKNHFDYRGLIKKGLALNAIGLNIY